MGISNNENGWSIHQKQVDGSSDRWPPEWREYASGWGAAVVNILVTFPINKTMFRQMVHGINLKEAMRQLKTEGSFHLYRGVLPPLLQKSTSTSIMFGTYSQYSRLLSTNGHQVALPAVHAAAAFMAGCTEATLAPFERVQVVLQETKYHDRFRNTAEAFRLIRAEHGLKEFYRGLSAVLMRNGPSNVIFFASREELKKKLPKQWTAHKQYAVYVADFLCGACTGAFISTLFYPINVTRTHMQLVIGGKYHNFTSVFLSLLKQRGLRGMFAGVHVNYTRSFISWGIINFMYEFIHERL